MSPDQGAGSSSVWRRCPRWRKALLINGLPPVGQIPERFITRDGINRLRYVDVTGTRSNTQRYDRVAGRAVELLRQHKIYVGRPVGKGRYAEVFSIEGEPDQVVKISGDQTEAAAWAYLLDMVAQGELAWSDLPSLAQVSCVMIVLPRAKRDRPLYVIVMERCQKLSRSECQLVERIDDALLGSRGAARSGLRAPYTVEAKVAKVVRRFRSVQDGQAHADRLLETLQATAGHSLFIYDIHGENVMRDDVGHWKITDLGMTETCCPVAIPILEQP